MAPVHICLYRADYSLRTLEFFRQIDIFHEGYDRCVIDFSQTLSMTAAAAVMAFARITRCQIAADVIGGGVTHQSIKIKYPLEKAVKRLFVSSGFFEAIKPGGLSKLKNLWEDRDNPFKTSNCPDNELSTVIKQLNYRLGSVPERLVSALSEGYLNIRHHAYSTGVHEAIAGRWWQYIVYNKSRGAITLVLYDVGSGVPSTIRNKYHTELGRPQDSDNKIIEYAMIKGKTRHPNDLGRGNGFTNIKKPMDISDKAKHLMVCSGQGVVKYSNQKIISSELISKYNFNGTLIEWCFEESES